MDVLAEVRRRFGISFIEQSTGGGCMCLEARLESGHWLIATDEGLCSYRERLDIEADSPRPMGWSIGIYPHSDEPYMDWFGVDSIVDVIDTDAYAEDLPDLIERALRELRHVTRGN